MPVIYAQLGGADGVKQTLSMMKRLANAALTDPFIRAQAAQVIASCPRGDKPCMAYALLSWVKRKVRYIPDPNGVEALHNPAMIAKAVHEGRLVYGDCDDMSLYLATLMKSVGLSPCFRAVGYNGNQYQHVYVACEGLTLDATRDEWNERPRMAPKETSIIETRV